LGRFFILANFAIFIVEFLIRKGVQMKRFFACLGLIALASCGGSEIGGNTAPDSGLVSNEVRASNKRITPLPSEVYISSNQGDEDITRAASSGLYARGYERYGLDNVKMKKYENFNPQNFTFMIDDQGKITAIKFDNQNSMRDGETNKFLYVITSGDDDDTIAETQLTYQTYASRAGLRFSDFGALTIAGVNSGADLIMPYIGGYDVKHINKGQIERNLVFNGVARGKVFSGATENPLELNGVGVLNFNATTGDEVLNANFGNWYPLVSVSKIGDNDPTLSISGTYSGDYELSNVPDNEQVVFDSDFYGSVDGQAEAVAAVDYSQGTENTADYRRVTIGFGGTIY